MHDVQKILSGNRVVIRKEIMDALKLKVGSPVLVSQSGDVVRIVPAEVRKREAQEPVHQDVSA